MTEPNKTAKQPNHPTVDDTIAFLNSLLEIDRDAVSTLFSVYVPCTKAKATPHIDHYPLADHPTVQVNCEGGKCEVGMLGILNGLFGVDERNWGFIGKVVQESDTRGRIEMFVRMSLPEAPQ
jgi:hypothetical protein